MANQLGGSPKCPRGRIRRRSYITYDGIRVRSTCVPKRRSSHRRQPRRNKSARPPSGNRRGKYGYNSHDAPEKRRAALSAAIRDGSYQAVVGRLVAAAKYLKNSAPRSYAAVMSDIEWAHAHFANRRSPPRPRKRTTPKRKMPKRKPRYARPARRSPARRRRSPARRRSYAPRRSPVRRRSYARRSPARRRSYARRSPARRRSFAPRARRGSYERRRSRSYY